MHSFSEPKIIQALDKADNTLIYQIIQRFSRISHDLNFFRTFQLIMLSLYKSKYIITEECYLGYYTEK